jgi:hypothetical protein
VPEHAGRIGSCVRLKCGGTAHTVPSP